jgi:hypothetical protein
MHGTTVSSARWEARVVWCHGAGDDQGGHQTSREEQHDQKISTKAAIATISRSDAAYSLMSLSFDPEPPI